MAWILVVLLYTVVPAQASHICDEVKIELDYAVQREFFPKKAARAIYLRCIKSQKHND